MNPHVDASKLSGELYRQWEKSMTEWWDSVLESPAFLQAMGSNLSAQAKARSSYEDGVEQTMQSLHLPSRRDMVRMTRVATLLEDRLLGMEDRLLEMGDRLEAMEGEVLRARVDAAEARVELRERLAELQAKLDAPAPKRSRATKKSPEA